MVKLSDTQWDAGVGEHICLVYETTAEQARVLGPFVGRGLARGEAAVYIADEQSGDAVRSMLWQAGVDVAAREANGSLSILDGRATYLPNGVFDPAAMLESLQTAVHGFVDAGYTGVRFTGEMTWAAGTVATGGRLAEYEAMLNHFYPGSRATGICQYHRSRFPAEVIRNVLRTHPIAVLGEDVCTNVYYEPPEFVLEGRPTDRQVEWMITQLRRQHVAEEIERGLRRAAETASEAKTRFLAMMSHELRTPLNAIIGYEQLISDGLSGPVTDQQRTQLGRIRTSAMHLLALIDEMLQLSRIESGHDEARDEVVDLRELMDEVSGVVGPMAAAKGLDFETRLQLTDPMIRSDARKLRQVLLNFLTNAVKFTEKGSVALEAESQGNEIVFGVRDTGIGITPADQRSIFEPFWQAAPLTTRTRGGTGLGLSLSKQLAELLGGSIEFESEVGKGSIFTLRLPRGPTVH
jgi:signal transduction histidine kinase